MLYVNRFSGFAPAFNRIPAKYRDLFKPTDRLKVSFKHKMDFGIKKGVGASLKIVDRGLNPFNIVAAAGGQCQGAGRRG